jgi:hypothetical protein
MEREVMIDSATTSGYETTLDEIRAAGLFKAERSLAVGAGSAGHDRRPRVS